jgi:hypothetical protein
MSILHRTTASTSQFVRPQGEWVFGLAVERANRAPALSTLSQHTCYLLQQQQNNSTFYALFWACADSAQLCMRVCVCFAACRLQAKGLLSDIQAEWEDWQHDLLLDTIQQQLLNHTAGGTSTAAPGRLRRGRNEMEGSCNAAAGSVSAGGVAQEPRRVSWCILQGFGTPHITRVSLGTHHKTRIFWSAQPGPATSQLHMRVTSSREVCHQQQR